MAFFLKKSYEKIVKKLGQGKAKNKGFFCREIVNFLKNQRIGAEYRYLSKKWRRKIYHHGTIVFIKRDKRYPFGHYLIRYQNFWMDPWINFIKEKDIKRAKAGFRKKLPGRPIYGIFVNQF